MARVAATYRANKPPSGRVRGVHPHQHPRAFYRQSLHLPHAGTRECARRARQIAAGSLRRENGLRSVGALLP
jgi:hypothetical protein